MRYFENTAEQAAATGGAVTTSVGSVAKTSNQLPVISDQ